MREVRMRAAITNSGTVHAATANRVVHSVHAELRNLLGMGLVHMLDTWCSAYTASMAATASCAERSGGERHAFSLSSCGSIPSRWQSAFVISSARVVALTERSGAKPGETPALTTALAKSNWSAMKGSVMTCVQLIKYWD